MANRQVKDALAVMAVSVGVATLAVLITAVLTGSHLWIGVFMVIPTLVITFRYSRSDDDFGGDEERPELLPLAWG